MNKTDPNQEHEMSLSLSKRNDNITEQQDQFRTQHLPPKGQ